MSRHFLLFLLVLYFLWLISRSRPSKNVQELTQTHFVEDHSLTVILPVTPNTISDLDHLLAPFLVSTTILYEVAIVCPHSLVSDIHRNLRTVVLDAPNGHPKVSLYPWSGLVDHHHASLQVISRIKTPWALLLDEHGFKQVTECDRAYLVHPRAVHLPIGPRGFTGSPHNWIQLSPSNHVQPAAFLVPPFVAPAALLENAPSTSPIWPVLGSFIASSTSASFGGLVIGDDLLHPVACNANMATPPDEESNDDPDSHTLASPASVPIFPLGFLILAFPREEDLDDFSPTACKLLHQGYTLLAYLYDVDSDSDGVKGDCAIPYVLPSKEVPSFSDWLDSLGLVPDILIGLDHRDLVSSTFSLILERPPFLNTTLIRLPRFALPYTEWIGTLTLHELCHWNVPEITLIVITNNRPYSLQRLLESIQRTLFYGDKVNIRVNMDQTSDPETMHLVQNFEWHHGDVFLHHRVIHGGLLPAVVESWYPHCDDSYGLLLEDDIELSPLSYAWLKMTLLRYKYGTASPSSSHLFGISLYQQKFIELRLAGRQPFSASTLFRSASLDPSTPYLSQIPCSWGALYFPTPWREFHAYLVHRHSQRTPGPIVPGVRSNKWTKSWKKYFIELVYLKGYVMLYPNYAEFVSLSTNHLEVGSHVRDAPEEVYAWKKQLFSLPLMSLAGGLAGAQLGLLDLPGGALPRWERLPVLDLLGELSSMDVIQKRGDERRSELDDCVDVALLPAGVRNLLCLVPL